MYFIRNISHYLTALGQGIFLVLMLLNIVYANDVIFDKTIYMKTKTLYYKNSLLQSAFQTQHAIDLQKRKDATIEFLAYSPLGDATGNILNGSDFTYNLENDTEYQQVDNQILNNIGLSKFQPIPFVNINFIKNGQILFIKLTDSFRNIDKNKIDTVTIDINSVAGNLTADNNSFSNMLFSQGGKIRLRLYETGNETGIFIGYILVKTNTSPNIQDNQGVLLVSPNSILNTTYKQQSTGNVQKDYITVNVDIVPQGRVFNSLTGEFLDNIDVTLLDARTNNPAKIYADDGITNFPSTIKTGKNITDPKGNIIDLQSGEYYFPFVPQGEYRIRLEGLTRDMVFPSTITNDDALSLNIPNIVLTDAGRGYPFTLNSSTAVGFDIPVDMIGEMSLIKTSSKKNISSGESVPYELTLTNNSNRTVRQLVIKDMPPIQLRYIQNSLKINNIPSGNITIDEKTLTMTIAVPDLKSNESVNISYVMRSIPNIPNNYILRNTAQATGYAGFYSNVATADVSLREDMLQSYGTIVGRVHFDSCDGNDYNDKEMVGLPNIRLLQENGEQVVTDINGRYSFSGVLPGTHVVQLDKITLPKGVTVEMCQDNTRHAGNNFSQFVDVKGGFVYKVNFVLKGDKEKFRQRAKKQADIITPAPIGSNPADIDLKALPQEMQKYNEEWLEKQTESFTLVYPNNTEHPNVKSLNFGVKYQQKYTVEAFINGERVSPLNLAATISNKNDTIRLSHYRGVDLERDYNSLILYLKNDDGKTISMIKRDIAFNQEIYNITYEKKESILSADGVITPEIAFKLTDKSGISIAAGRNIRVEVSAPYSFKQAGYDANLKGLNQSQDSGGAMDIPMSEDGLLKIQLAPTAQSGNAKFKIYTDLNEYKNFDVWLSTPKRDWVLVGLASGTAAYNKINGNIETSENQGHLDKDLAVDNKIAFYSKGMISKNWLMTLSYDKNRKKDREKMRLFNQIAPDQKFAVVGDMSRQSNDSPSQYPLYLKLERDHFYALFGDYDTNLSNSEILPYARRLSGFQTVYSGRNYSIQAFASQEAQTFIRDDIRLDGTSGPYKLNGINIIQGSERVYLERRALNNATQITESTPLTRYVDYDLDYNEGLITLRANALPFTLNSELVFLRTEFETYSDGKEKSTYGARATKNFMGDDVVLGMTAIQDGGGQTGTGDNQGYNADAKIRLTRNTDLNAEYARTRSNSDGRLSQSLSAGSSFSSSDTGTDAVTADARRFEIEHRGDALFARSFYTEKNNGFGFGTDSAFDTGSQQYGVEVIYDFTEKSDKSIISEDGLFIKNGLSAYLKTNKTTDTGGQGDLSISEIGLTKDADIFKSYVGFRDVQENLNFSYAGVNGTNAFDSSTNLQQFMSGTQVDVVKNKLSLFGTTEIPINQEQNNGFYGNKQTVGTEITPLDSTTVNLAHQWVDIGGDKSENTIAGVGVRPFEGMNVTTGTTRHALPSEDLYAFDSQITQQLNLAPTWTVNLGIKRHDAVGGKNGIYTQIDEVPDYALPSFLRNDNIRSPFSASSRGYWEDYTTIGAGIIKSEEKWSISTTSEFRNSETENRYNLALSWLGDVNKDFAVGLQGAYQLSKFKNGMTTEKFIDDIQKRLESSNISRRNDISLNRLSLLRNSQIANVTGGSAYRPFDEKGAIILHRTELEMRDGFDDDSFFKAVNNLAVQANITDKLELNGEYATKYIQESFAGQETSDVVHILGTSMRYDINKKWDIGVSGLVRRSVATNIQDYSTGLNTGYSPAKNMYLQAGYNILGFQDKDISMQSYTAKGPYIRFNLKFDQDSVKENVQDFLRY